MDRLGFPSRLRHPSTSRGNLAGLCVERLNRFAIAPHVIARASRSAQQGERLVPVLLPLEECATLADARERADLAVAAGATWIEPDWKRSSGIYGLRGEPLSTLGAAPVGRLTTYVANLCWAMRKGKPAANVAILFDAQSGQESEAVAFANDLTYLGYRVHTLSLQAPLASSPLDTGISLGDAHYEIFIRLPGQPIGDAGETGWMRAIASCAERGGTVIDLSEGEQPSPRPSEGWITVRSGGKRQSVLAAVESVLRRRSTPKLLATPRTPGTVILAQRRTPRGAIAFLFNAASHPQTVDVEVRRWPVALDVWDCATGVVRAQPMVGGGFRPLVEPKSGVLFTVRDQPNHPMQPASWFGHGPGNRTWLDLSGDWSVRTDSRNLIALSPNAAASDARYVAYHFEVHERLGSTGLRVVLVGWRRPPEVRYLGHKLDPPGSTFIAGLSGWTYPLPKLATGWHTLEVEYADDQQQAGWVILLSGRFSAHVMNDHMLIGKPMRSARLADFVVAGLPQYIGAVSWEKTVHVSGTGPWVVDVAEQQPSFRSLVELWVDGVACSRHAWPPYETDVTNYITGTAARLHFRTVAPIPAWARQGETT
jgi:hypothetical protein